MHKVQVDQLYHLLRVASNIAGEGTMTIEGRQMDVKTGLTPSEEVSTIYGLCRHLLAGGDYSALVRFSQYYGTRFLLDPTCEAVVKTNWSLTRVVELGAGLGWLGRGLASRLGLLPTLFVDKRPWVLIDKVADLETEDGRNKVLEVLRDGDLIAAADLLHCLDDSGKIMGYFAKWPMVILEYCSGDIDYNDSYATQISRYGADPLTLRRFRDMFPGRKVDTVDLDPYILLLVDKEE